MEGTALPASSLASALSLALLLVAAPALGQVPAEPAPDLPAPAAVPPAVVAAPPPADGRLARLEAENRRLRDEAQQLQQRLAESPWPRFDEQQRWFVVGGATALASFLLGMLIARGRRRRQWLN